MVNGVKQRMLCVALLLDKLILLYQGAHGAIIWHGVLTEIGINKAWTMIYNSSIRTRRRSRHLDVTNHGRICADTSTVVHVPRISNK